MGCKDFEETLTTLTPLSNCNLLYASEEESVEIPYWTDFLLPKVTDMIPDPQVLDYLCPQHSIMFDGERFDLKVGALTFDPATCAIGYTNERGEAVQYFIPQDQFVYDAATCTLTILPAKGSPGIVIPVGVPASQVKLSLAPDCNGCVLRFEYKDRICDVPLPNMVVGCTYDAGTNTLSMLMCDGTAKPINLPKSSLNVMQLPDGTQVISFDNGCPGGTTTFSVPGVVLDTDNLTVTGSQLLFTYGGDGNDNTVLVDICDIVAGNCNATITDVFEDGFAFVDNAGNTFELRFRNCCTFFGNNPAELIEGVNLSNPAGTYPNKADGDTAIECHPNGLSFWTCVGGAWSFNYSKVFANTVHYHSTAGTPIDPANPPVSPENPPASKNEGDTLNECRPNGWCGYTCQLGVWVRDWCKVDPVIPELPTFQSTDGSVDVSFDSDGNVWNFMVTHPTIPDPEKETFKAGDTLPSTASVIEVCLDDDSVVSVGANTELPDNMVGCVQVDEADGTTAYFPPKARTVPPEVFVGVTAPEKGIGFTVWFNPVTCVVKFCDNAGEWQQPTNLACQEDQPSTEKGGHTLWFKPSNACFSVLCGGVWIGVNGVTASSVTSTAADTGAGTTLITQADGTECEVNSTREFWNGQNRAMRRVATDLKTGAQTIQHFNPTVRCYFGATNANEQFEPGDLSPNDILPGSETCVNFVMPECGGIAEFFNYFSFSKQQFVGTINLFQEYQVDGGPWLIIPTGGVSQIAHISNAPPAYEAEEGFGSKGCTPFLTAGAHEICVRLRVQGVFGQAGFTNQGHLQTNVGTTQVYVNEMVTC